MENNNKFGFIWDNHRALILVGINTALLYAINFFSGQVLSAAFAIPGLSGIVTGFTVPFFLVLTFLTTRGYGTFTLMWTLYSAAAIPTLLMGPPGPYKIIIGLFAGLTFDIVVYLFKGRKYSLYIGFFFYTMTMMAMFLSLLYFLELPGFDTTIAAVAIITIVFIIEGLISVKLAIKASPRMERIGKSFSVVD